MPEEELDRIISLEIFDEYEEFDLLCSHYFVLIATCGKLAESFPPYQTRNNDLENEKYKVYISLEVLTQSIER